MARTVKRLTRDRTHAANSSKLCDAARKRAITWVVPFANPLQPIKALHTKLDGIKLSLGQHLIKHTQDAARVRGMKAPKGKRMKIRPHVIMMHADSCYFGVCMLPRASNGADLEEMQKSMSDMRENCSCKPFIMYPGALA